MTWEPDDSDGARLFQRMEQLVERQAQETRRLIEVNERLAAAMVALAQALHDTEII